jgi:replicative DNA helicase
LSEAFEKLVSALAESGRVEFLIEHPELRDYVRQSPVDASLFALVDNHVLRYGKIPARETIEDQWGQPLPKTTGPAEFYLPQLKAAYVRDTLQAALNDAQKYMKTNPERSRKIIDEAVTILSTPPEVPAIVDYRESLPRIMKHLASKLKGGGISLGWPSYDETSGGLMPGDFVSLVGFSGFGKTQMLLSRALYFWEVLNLPVLFISGEMNLDAILERAAALDSHVPADYLKHGLFPNVGPTNYKEKLIKRLKDAAKAPTPLYFIDANLAMFTSAIQRLCRRLEPAVVCVDGAATLAGHSYHRRWEAIAETTTFLKRVICNQMGILTIATYQFTNEARRAFENEKVLPSLSDIAGSVEIGNLSTVCLGMMPDDTVDIIPRRKISILKGRNGETGSFYTHWNFRTMNFAEFDEYAGDTEEDVEIT